MKTMTLEQFYGHLRSLVIDLAYHPFMGSDDCIRVGLGSFVGCWSVHHPINAVATKLAGPQEIIGDGVIEANTTYIADMDLLRKIGSELGLAPGDVQQIISATEETGAPEVRHRILEIFTSNWRRPLLTSEEMYEMFMEKG